MSRSGPAHASPERTERRPGIDTDPIHAAFAASASALVIFRRVGERGLQIDRANPSARRLFGLDGGAADAAPDPALVSAVLTSVEHDGARQLTLPAPDTERMVVTARALETGEGERYVFADLGRAAADRTRSDELVGQLLSLLDNSPALVFIKDAAGRYLFVNRHFSQIFRTPANELVGTTDYDLFPRHVAQAYRDNDAAVMRGDGPVEVEEPFAALHEDADPVGAWLSIKFPLFDGHGQPYAVGAISTDISDRKRAELVAAQARQSAEDANRAKDAFLSRISHELRTPLNAILGFAQLLHTADLPPEQHAGVGYIADAGKHLLALVNDLLDLSWTRADAPGLHLETISAAEPIQQALELARPIARSRDIEIASDLHAAIDEPIHADRQRLRQVLLNLLANAIKFNRPAGAVRVSSTRRGEFVRYLVTDTGPGMNAEVAAQVFTPFTRFGAREVEGTGLGLALSRELVEHMGGALGILHTAPGEGSTFFVDVPRSAEPITTQSRDETSLDRELAALGEATIVLVEDTWVNVRLVETVFAGNDRVHLHSAATGIAALALIAHVRPDLVLLDMHLPDMSGTAVLDALAGTPELAGTPVIVVSADATPALIRALPARGVVDYVTKPIDVKILLRAIRQALTRDRP